MLENKNLPQSLGSVQKLVDRAYAHIKNTCTVDGKLDEALLDNQQLVTYELAFCSAQLRGAGFMLSHGLNSANGLDQQYALAFCADALNEIRQTLSARYPEFGLSLEQLNQSFDSDVLGFVASHISASFLAGLGQQVVDSNGSLGSTGLDDEKEMMRESFDRLAQEVVAPLAEKIHRQDLDIPEQVITELAQMGSFGLSIPESYGGTKPDDSEDHLAMIVVTEALSKASLGVAGSLITRPEIMAKALLAGGTPEQKQHWLPKLAEANPLCAISITEPNYGSDVASMRLKATRTEGGWLLNGAKTWCTFAGQAGVLLTLARTDPDLGKGHKGLSLFIVEKPHFSGHEFAINQDQGGKLSGKAIATIGYRGMHSYDLFFEDYFVDDDALLGGGQGLGKGFYYTMSGFSGGRIQTAARANGLMEAAYGQALRYAQERQVFGKALADYQLTLVKLARMAMLLASSRQFTYGVGEMMDQGQGQMEASLVKLYACKSSEWVCREALQIHGGMGYAEESPVSRYFIDARVLSIFEGAEETLALKVIGRALINQA